VDTRTIRASLGRFGGEELSGCRLIGRVWIRVPLLVRCVRDSQVEGHVGDFDAAGPRVVEEGAECFDTCFSEDEAVNLGVGGQCLDSTGRWQPESAEVAVVSVVELRRPRLELGERISRREVSVGGGRRGDGRVRPGQFPKRSELGSGPPIWKGG
jgi:hypothetical protein